MTTGGRLRSVKAQLAGVAMVLVAATAVAAATASGGGDGLGAHPAPTLFADADVAPLGRQLAAQKPRADRDFAAWAATHPRRDDAAFTSFALAQLAPPPGADVEAGELSELRALAATRTKDGLRAADWLEAYGKTAVWEQYLRDAVETSSRPVAAQATKAFLADVAIAKVLARTTEQRFARRSPSAVEPTLRRHARPAKLSYPSAHAVFVYAELGVLTALDPGRAPDFTRMADQISYSRLYAAGHYRSDLLAGAYLGDLLGDYASRGLGRP